LNRPSAEWAVRLGRRLFSPPAGTSTSSGSAAPSAPAA